MSMQGRAQFTPGPWSLCNWMVGNNTPTGEVTICGPEGDEHICTMDGNEDNQANGNLIAAAPAMYEALQNLLEWAKGNRGAREGNPYCKPEVRQALKVLASIQGKKDYLDADTAPQAEGRQA